MTEASNGYLAFLSNNREFTMSISNREFGEINGVKWVEVYDKAILDFFYAFDVGVSFDAKYGCLDWTLIFLSWKWRRRRNNSSSHFLRWGWRYLCHLCSIFIFLHLTIFCLVTEKIKSLCCGVTSATQISSKLCLEFGSGPLGFPHKPNTQYIPDDAVSLMLFFFFS